MDFFHIIFSDKVHKIHCISEKKRKMRVIRNILKVKVDLVCLGEGNGCHNRGKMLSIFFHISNLGNTVLDSIKIQQWQGIRRQFAILRNCVRSGRSTLSGHICSTPSQHVKSSKRICLKQARLFQNLIEEYYKSFRCAESGSRAFRWE